MTQKIIHEFNLNGVPLRLETGEIANHAQSAFMVYYGETVVLVTVTVGNMNPELDFFPLTVDYTERLYAGGFISSSPYIKREGRPTEVEILNSRLIDHAIRSLFPSNFRNETQIIAQVISYDKEHDPLIASLVGTSFAFSYSGLPFLGPYGACKVGLFNDEIVINPDLSQEWQSKLEMVVSSVDEGIVSVEAEVHDIPEEIVKKGISKALEFNKTLIEEQNKFLEKYGKKDYVFEPAIDKAELEELTHEIEDSYKDQMLKAIYLVDKMSREQAMREIKKQIDLKYESKVESEEILATDINKAYDKALKTIVRTRTLNEEVRPDGRGLKDVREISARVGVLPRVHGSALFNRGETQTLTVVTLGTERDEQQMQDLSGEHTKRYFHHYNMPGYANGEVDRKLGFPNRRAIGHGMIGEKSLVNMIANTEEFPYTIRVVSEVTSSNGSTSMAATCGSTLALMDAGVPIKKIIGGIGIGLVYEGKDKYKVLTDIIGMEDFYGDMDFKITGSRDGITAIQLDNKMAGIPEEILFEAIDQSKIARIKVIDEMEKCLTVSRTNTSKYAPKAKQIKIDPETIGDLIGPGGKSIRSITEKTGVEITIDQDNSGNVMVYADSEEKFEEAMKLINLAVGDIGLGSEYDAKIVRIEPFGVFIEIPNTHVQGMIHVSNLGKGYVKDIKDVVKLGDILKVKYMGKDEKGRTKFETIKSDDQKQQEPSRNENQNK